MDPAAAVSDACHWRQKSRRMWLPQPPLRWQAAVACYQTQAQMHQPVWKQQKRSEDIPACPKNMGQSTWALKLNPYPGHSCFLPALLLPLAPIPRITLRHLPQLCRNRLPSHLQASNQLTCSTERLDLRGTNVTSFAMLASVKLKIRFSSYQPWLSPSVEEGCRQHPPCHLLVLSVQCDGCTIRCSSQRRS